MKTFLCVAVAVACVFLLAEGIETGGDSTCVCAITEEPVCSLKIYGSPCERDCDRPFITYNTELDMRTNLCDRIVPTRDEYLSGLKNRYKNQ